MGKLQAGVFMLRPCAEVTRHMLQLLAQDPRLHFKQDHAEQDFLDWYFKVSRQVLHWPWPHYPADQALHHWTMLGSIAQSSAVEALLCVKFAMRLWWRACSCNLQLPC